MEYDLTKPAYVYICSKGRSTYPTVRILYIMSVGDAQKLCSHDKTKGIQWALFWTDKGGYDSHADNQDLIWQQDDGRFEEIFCELGIKEYQTIKTLTVWNKTKVKNDNQKPAKEKPQQQLSLFSENP